MDRLIAPNSVDAAHADTAPATGTPQYATDGNPATGVPATLWPAYAFNTIQDEIYNVIIAAGLTPDRTKWNQLLTAIQMMLQGATTNIGVDTGAANAYVVAFTPALSAPIPWAPFWVKIKTANAGASTLNATGTAEPLVGGGHQALQGGELVANGDALIYWNPTLNSGGGAYVLVFCTGAAKQIAPATASQHAMQYGQATGRVIGIQHFVASTTYIPTPGTTSIEVEIVGGGAAGGSTNATGAGQVAIGGGGGAGGYARSRYTSGFSGVAITIGAGGTAASPAGGTTSFGALMSATGGTQGASGVNTVAAPPFSAIGGLGGVGSGGNIVNAQGGQGIVGIAAASTSFVSGAGGQSAFGMGGGAQGTTSNTGSAAPSAGGGGGGALAGASTAAQNGGAGAAGVCIIREYS